MTPGDIGVLFGELDGFLRQGGFIPYNLYKPRTGPSGALCWGNTIYIHAAKMGM